MNEIRINARLDEQASKDLSFLREELSDYTITDIVKFSIQKAAQELRDKSNAKQQNQIWLESGFVGGFDAPDDLSINYKKYLADILDEKYPTE